MLVFYVSLLSESLGVASPRLTIFRTYCARSASKTYIKERLVKKLERMIHSLSGCLDTPVADAD